LQGAKLKDLDLLEESGTSLLAKGFHDLAIMKVSPWLASSYLRELGFYFVNIKLLH